MLIPIKMILTNIKQIVDFSLTNDVILFSSNVVYNRKVENENKAISDGFIVKL